MALSGLQKKIEHYWYSRPGPLWALYPLECVFRFASNVKRKNDTAKQRSLNVPVLVVGNINVGGTGKTPVLISLLKYLCSQGLKPGVISRGFGRVEHSPVLVDKGTSSQAAGEEPLLIFRETACPVSVHADRHFAALTLLKAYPDCDVILADDGLQHYKLKRDFELVVVDAERMFGNQHLLPLGPLREKPERLKTVDWIVVNQRNAAIDQARMQLRVHKLDASKVNIAELKVKTLRHLQTNSTKTLDEFNQQAGAQRITALAAIGNPQAFFTSLSVNIRDFDTQVFPDHYYWRAEELQSLSGRCLICTTKDAVKLREVLVNNAELNASQWYCLEVELELPLQLKQDIYNAIMSLKS